MRNKGEIIIGAVVTGALLFGLIGVGLYKTNENGVLKNNGKKIWCKMQNKGANYCDETYAFTPKEHNWALVEKTIKVPVYVESE